MDQGTAFTGGAGNDTFTGLVDYTAGGIATSASTTYNVTDVLAGGAGTDTLNLTVTGSPNATVTLPAATVTGIEAINVRSVLTVAQTVTMAASGATTLNADRATDAVVFTGLASGATFGSITGGAAVSGTYAAGVTAGTFNAQSGVTVGAITVTANSDNLMTAVNINSTGAANVLSSANVATGTGVKAVNINATTNLTTGNITGLAAGTTITVTGAATAVNLGALQSTVTTVTATGLAAGGITATIGALAQVLTLGGGVNVITTGGTQTGAVTAGAGTADKLIVVTATDVAATPAAKFTGFEILQNNTTSNLDASLVSGITSVVANDAAAGFTGMNATQAAAVRLLVSNTSGTFALTTATGTADVLNVKLENLLPANAAIVISHTGALVAGFETMNVAVNSGISTAVTVAAANSADQIAFTTATNLKTLAVTGAYSVGISAASTTAVALTSINASGLTGSTAGAGITLGGNTGALTVTGSNNTDFVLLGTLGIGGTVTVNTGSGNDTVTGTQAQVAAAVINGGTNTAAGDKLELTDTATTIADNTFVNVTGIEKITLGNTTALTWVVGGYANALATGNGGVLDVTAASIAAAGTIAVDASGLGAGNALKLSMTNTAGGTNAVNITGSNSGADSITYVGATSGTGVVTVSAAGTGGSTAVKTVDLSGELFGTAAITTGAGADVIKTGTLGATITAGKGADAITLLSTHSAVQAITLAVADTATFAAPSTNTISTVGFDVITGGRGTGAVADTIQIGSGSQSGGTSMVATINTANDLSTATYANQTATNIRGTFNAATNTFVGASTGADSLLVFDSTIGVTVTYEAIVLVGTGAGALASISNAGLITF